MTASAAAAATDAMTVTGVMTTTVTGATIVIAIGVTIDATIDVTTGATIDAGKVVNAVKATMNCSAERK